MSRGVQRLRAPVLTVVLLLTATTRTTDTDTHVSLLARLINLLRTTESIDAIKRTGTRPATGWRTRSYPLQCFGMADDSVYASTDGDEDGAPLNAADFDKALQLQRRNTSQPVDEPILEDDSLLDDIMSCGGGDALSPSDPANNAVLSAEARWPGGQIPYTIASGFSESDRAAIAAGVLQLERSTCIRLRAKGAADTDYVRIVRGSGCYSSVGRQRAGGQELSLGSGCLYSGIVAHELMHAVGFWHEQSRPDRDKYVHIHYDNIKESAKHNFKTYGRDFVQTLSLPYDVGSIMHYGAYAFARDRSRPTITSLCQPSAEMGQRHALSRLDIQKVNSLYQCDGGTTIAPCEDKNVYCSDWAAAGECDDNPAYMHDFCALSCSTCSEQGGGEGDTKHCAEWAANGECDSNPDYMHQYCRHECGLCSGGGGPTAGCSDDHQHCQAWADAGECTANPSYMHVSCRRSCGKCG